MKPEWCLEFFHPQRMTGVRVPMKSLPFSVGRSSSSDLVLKSQLVSSGHAEIVERQHDLWICDHGSTNGTFVNGEKIFGDQRINERDILHVADVELRLVKRGRGVALASAEAGMAGRWANTVRPKETDTSTVALILP